MSLRYFLLPAALVLGNLTSASAIADTVVLRSGDHLGGKIMRKSGDTLTLQTDYAGEIRIQWSKIASIATDAPVTVQLEGIKLPLKAKLDAASPEQGNPDQVHLTGGDSESAYIGVGTIPLSRILYINPLPEETLDGVSYKGRANLSVAKTNGNSSSQNVYGETDFAAHAREYRYDLNAKFNRGTQSGTLVSSNWLIGGNYDHFLDPKQFLYDRASLEKDLFKGIDRRATLGGGYGRQLIDTPQTQFSIRGGLDYVAVKHSDTGSDDHYPSLGWGIKFSHKLDGFHAELFHEQDGFWNLRDTSQITLRTHSGLRIPLMAGITASSQLNLDWERRPARGRKPTDSMLLFGLGYEW